MDSAESGLSVQWISPADHASRPAARNAQPSPLAADEHRAQQAQHRAGDDHAVVDPDAEEVVEPVGAACRAGPARPARRARRRRRSRSARTAAGMGVPRRIGLRGDLGVPPLRAARGVDLQRADPRGLLGALGAAEEDVHLQRAVALDRAAADARDADADLGLLAGLDRVGLVGDLLEAPGAAGAVGLGLLRVLGEALERDDAGAAAGSASRPGS